MRTILTSQLTYNEDRKTFSAEISDLGKEGLTGEVSILNPKTGVSKLYTLFKTDRDGSGEDIYGWWFRNEETQTKLLIIND